MDAGAATRRRKTEASMPGSLRSASRLRERIRPRASEPDAEDDYCVGISRGESGDSPAEGRSKRWFTARRHGRFCGHSGMLQESRGRQQGVRTTSERVDAVAGVNFPSVPGSGPRCQKIPERISKYVPGGGLVRSGGNISRTLRDGISVLVAGVGGVPGIQFRAAMPGFHFGGSAEQAERALVARAISRGKTAALEIQDDHGHATLVR